MNKILKNIYTLCLVASLAASFAYLSDLRKSEDKPFIFISHFSKKVQKAHGEPVLSSVKVKDKVKVIVKKKKVTKTKKITFAKPVTKKINIKNVNITKPNLDVREPVKAVVAASEDNVVNNNELIQHYGYNVKTEDLAKISWSEYFQNQNIDRKLASLNEGEGPTLEKQNEIEEKKIAEIKKQNEITNQKIEDFVKTVSSQKLNTQTEDTDLVFYDYSKSDDEDENVSLANQVDLTIKTKAVEQPKIEVEVVNNKKTDEAVLAAQNENKTENPNTIISKNVLAAYEREMGETPKMAMANNPLNTQAKSRGEYSKVIDQISKKRSAAKKMNTQTSGYSKTILTTYEVNIGENTKDTLRSFQFTSASEGNNRLEDNNNGYINIETELASSQGVYRGTILKRDYLRTTMDIALEPGTIEVAIPSISQESMMKFLDSHQIRGLGGFLLVDRDRGIDSLDLDAEFEAKFDFDENFRITEDETAKRYVLFAGVTAGNSLLKIRTVDNEYSEKIIHIVEDEVLFEALLITSPETMKVTTLERTILSNTATELDIDSDKIRYFNRDIKAEKMASNLHEIKVPIQPLGMRRYLAFSHMEETVYVGIGDNKNVELPSSDFIVNLLEANNMSGMEGKCVIQINLQRELLSVTTNGESARGPMALDKFYLEKNGSLSEEETPLSTKVFILGDHQGIINLKIEYQDKTTDYLQTFCSPETYLLEQL